MKSFIETQFPVSFLSKESYKERKANTSQTLTGLGKWWGRKPLVLVRATILGLLLPSTDNPERDREIFLKLMMMDDAGLWRRKSKSISLTTVWERLTPRERQDWFDLGDTETIDERGLNRMAVGTTPRRNLSVAPSSAVRLRLRDDLPGQNGMSRSERSVFTTERREKLQRIVFERMSYDEKLAYCDRPEHVENLDEATWDEINEYVGTHARGFAEFIKELGERRFGHTPRIGDAFCGGGSVPFEAARIGCEAFGSDLNPVAALLTWAALNIIGGGEEIAEKVRNAQAEVFDSVDQQIDAWGVEHHAEGWRADAYIYCIEVRCPECGWMVPLAPSWVLGEHTKTIAVLAPDSATKTFTIEIHSGVDESQVSAAKNSKTVANSSLVCPNGCEPTPIAMIRGDRRAENGEGTIYGLRMWQNRDVVPRTDDVLQERLYCIRWVESYIDHRGKPATRRFYRAPDIADIEREKTVLRLLNERFEEWQEKGYIPSRLIDSGYNTDQPIRERGWTHWHHLFNPRQLLVLGLLNLTIFEGEFDDVERVTSLLGLQRAADHNSRLSGWSASAGKELVDHVFANQALNTLSNYGTRAMTALESAFKLNLKEYEVTVGSVVKSSDARTVESICDFWITDPPYADAVNYHELSEFFLSWYDKSLQSLFPDWYADSKRALAVTGSAEDFRQSMVECYRNLAEKMPDDGLQVVMFTHQDPTVWADLALILWAAGLRVTSAWCIATETDSALRAGNYVQGTVLLVLRKQTGTEVAFTDELIPQVEAEVKSQLAAMLALDERHKNDEPDFGDTDYQLAAYAAALRVLTQFRNIEDLDVARELTRQRRRGETSPVVEIINQAVRVACDFLVPSGFNTFIWKTLSPSERFYLKGLDLEAHGEYRNGAYQELARGFGVRDYRPLLSTGEANKTKLKTGTEFGTRNLGSDSAEGFGNSLVRQALFAVREAVRTENAQVGLNYLKNASPMTYWNDRKNLIEILNYLASMRHKTARWITDSEAARLVAGSLENDSV